MSRPGGAESGDPLELLRLLWSVYHRMQAVSKNLQTRRGLSGQQRLLLKLIARRPGTTAGELARTIGVHPSTLTASFRSLEEGGFVARTAPVDDARRACFRLSPTGEEEDRALSGTVEAALLRLLGRTDRAEWERARDWLVKLIEELDAELPHG